MNSRSQIAALLRQWLQRTREESRSIQAGDWSALRQLQEAKATLRPRLTAAIDCWRAESSGKADLTIFSQDIRRLLALETQNGELIVARRHQAQEKKRLLEQALFNLRRVRSSYAPPSSQLSIHIPDFRRRRSELLHVRNRKTPDGVSSPDALVFEWRRNRLRV